MRDSARREMEANSDHNLIRRQLAKIRTLMDNGQSELVKNAIKKNKSSMSSLRNWLNSEEKAFNSHDVRKGVLAKIANSLPELQNITRRTVYDFILEESGGDSDSQRLLNRYYGSYKIVHNLNEVEFRDLIIAHHANSNFPYFFFIMTIGPSEKAPKRIIRKSDGFVFSTGAMLVLSGIEQRLDSLLYLTEPFSPDEVMHGIINLHLKDMKKVISAKVALFKIDLNDTRQAKKLNEATQYIRNETTIEMEA